MPWCRGWYAARTARRRRTDPKSKEANGEATGEGDRRTARRRASLKATNADSERRRGDGVGDGNGADDGHGVGGDGDDVGGGDGASLNDAAVRWPPAVWPAVVVHILDGLSPEVPLFEGQLVQPSLVETSLD